MPFDGNRFDRRNMLKALGAGGAMALAGCTGDGDDGGQTSDGTTTTEGGSGGAATSQEPSTPGERPVGGTWISGRTSDAKTLIPYLTADEASDNSVNIMVDYPTAMNEQLEMEGRLFKSWTQSDSNDVIEYELRDNLQYSEPYGQLTAEDYMYDLQHIRQTKGKDQWHGYSYVDQFYINGEPIKYEKQGKYKIRAELPEPRANYKFNDYFAYMRPLPKEILEKYAPKKDLEGLKKDPVLVNGEWTGNLGPFTLDSWERQSKMVFKRNPDYYLAETEQYKNAPYFDEFVYQVFEEQSTITSALKTGEVTSAGLDEFKADVFKKRDDVQVWTSQYGEGMFYLTLNHRKNGWEGFRNKEVRQAMALALDKDVMIEQISQGYGDKLHTWSPKWGPYYSEDNVWIPNGPKIEEAKSKIESALPNYSYENGKLMNPDGEQVSLKLVYLTGSKSTKLTKDYAKSQLAKIGINVTLQGTSWTNLLGQYANNSGNNTDWSVSPYNGGPWDQSTSKKQWDMMLGIGFSSGAYTPWSVIRMLFTQKGSFNWIGYNPEKDIPTMLDKAASAATREKTDSLLQEVLAYISREQPVVFYISEHRLLGYRDKVGGIEEPENYFTSNEPERELYFEQ